MRKHGIFALLVLLAALCLTLPAAACEYGDCTLTHPDPIPAALLETEEPADQETELLAEPDYEGALEALRQAIWDGEASVSLSRYTIPATQADMQYLAEELSRMPETFALEFSACRFWHDGKKVLSLDLAYTMAAADYEAAKAVYTAGVESVTERVDPDWSVEETLLFVHDDLATHYEYDTGFGVYDAYGFFSEGKGVCQAYTMAVLAILRELDIPVTYVQSDNLDHIWNLVRVGDAWYHMDVTHDDPLQDRPGYARHTHFLQSDTASFAEHTEDKGADWPNDWVYGRDIPEAERSDTRYDGYFWRDSLSSFVNGDGVWYVVTADGLTTWDGKSDAFGTVLEKDPYFGAYDSGLTLDRGTLYYNSYWDVRSYELFTGRQEIVLELEEDVNALGVFAEDGILRYGYYWWESVDDGQGGMREEYHTAGAELDLGSPYRAAEGGYGYYVSDGTVFVEQQETRPVVVACYDEDGRMLDLALLTGTDSHRLRAAGSVKLLAPDAVTWNPRCAVLAGSVNRI